MISGSTFSLTVEEYVYTWKVSTLIKASKNVKTIDWTIPKSFYNDWSWDNGSLEAHIERCLAAELKHPIIIWDNKILDGVHRTIKTIALGNSTIKAKETIDIPPPDLIEKENTTKLNVQDKSFKEVIDLVKTKIVNGM